MEKSIISITVCTIVITTAVRVIIRYIVILIDIRGRTNDIYNHALYAQIGIYLFDYHYCVIVYFFSATHENPNISGLNMLFSTIFLSARCRQHGFHCTTLK